MNPVAPTVVRKTIRVNEFGVYAFPPSLEDAVVGRDVEIRDWYGDTRAEVLGVSLGLSGYPAALELRLEDGRHVPAFSLNCTREIEVLS